MCLLGVGGGLLEFSEGHAFMAAIHIGSGPLGFGFHGIESDMRVRGASGVIYAIMFAQVALLIMNWRELRCERWLRLLVLVGLTSMEVVMYVTNPNHGTAYFAHLFGALIGIGISVICAQNVKVRWFEPILIAVAFVAHVAYCIVMFGTGQSPCGLWGLLIVPKLMVDTYMYWRKATVTRKAKRLIVSTVGNTKIAKFASKSKFVQKSGAVASSVVNTVDAALVAVNRVDDALNADGTEAARGAECEVTVKPSTAPPRAVPADSGV